MTTRYATTPPSQRVSEGAAEPSRRSGLGIFRSGLKPWFALIAALALTGFTLWCWNEAFRGGAGAAGAESATLTPEGALTLTVFAVAIWLWIFSPIGDTYVALGAALLLVLLGTLSDEEFFRSLGEDTVWLLLAAFVIAAGLTTTGLSTRAAAYVAIGAEGVRPLFHLLTAFMVATAYAIPSTSGRAALLLPVFTAIAHVLTDRSRVVLALSLLFPSVILLSAVASYLGAGAHLITSQILQTSGYEGFTFASWLILGLPLAFVSSHLCAELILWLFTDREDRRASVRITVEQMQRDSPVPLSGPLTVGQTRAALLIGTVVVLWCTQSLHGLHPAAIALIGALMITSPRYGSVGMNQALKSVPWPMLLFMAATLTLGTALATTGAAAWLAESTLGAVSGDSGAAPLLFVVLVVVISTGAHLVIQSRSARSAVLIPLVVSLAPGVGVDPVAAAFASTAAAGFCHTLTSSAKPVTLFSEVEDIPTYAPGDLLKLSAFLAPLTAALVLVFSLFIWPLLGLPLFR